MTFTDADFDKLSFHDVRVYGHADYPDRKESRFDVDYLVEWLKKPKSLGRLWFLISPATLVFENVAAKADTSGSTPPAFVSTCERSRSNRSGRRSRWISAEGSRFQFLAIPTGVVRVRRDTGTPTMELAFV